MASFSTPQELEVHYEREHIIGESNGNDHGLIQQSVQEIQSTLKEEQFYSSELKKEVEKLSHAVQKSTEDKSKAEMDLCQSQIGALSEAKDLCELQIFMIFVLVQFLTSEQENKKIVQKFKEVKNIIFDFF